MKSDLRKKAYTSCINKRVLSLQFAKSVPMVSYLVCFIVCDFSYQEKYTKAHNTKFRVYSTPTQNTRLEYAVDIGANITDYFEDYFGVR